MCCSRIRVTLNGVVNDKWGSKAGTYQKASGLINKRSHWKRADKVTCGRHSAPSCKECPNGNGASWCNGECMWKNDECQSDPSSTGGLALWYDIIANNWMIGPSSDLGSNGGYIYSVQETACPNSENLFKYWNSSEFLLAPINSVSIQCV